MAFSVLPTATLRAQVPSYQNYSIERVGLFGPRQTGRFTGLQESFALFFNASGFVAGTSNRYTELSNSDGQNAWASNGTTTTQIGLTGGAYSDRGLEYSEPLFQNAAGQVAGISARFSPLNFQNNGQDAWAWNGTITTQIGLSGPGYSTSGGYQFSQPWLQNAAGQVAGSSLRYGSQDASLGLSAWVWNGTTTTLTGLTGAANTGSAGYRSSRPMLQSAAGWVAGYSTRISGVSTGNGQNAWVWNGTTTTQIGLTGAAYTGSAGYQRSEPLFFNDATNFVVGTSNRYTGVSTDNGQTTWVWFGITEPIGLIGADFTGSAGYQFSTPKFQNADGRVVGTSRRYTGVSTYNGQNAWAWNGQISIPIGLTGAGYVGSAGYQVSQPQFYNDAGQVAGYSRRVTFVNTENGQNAWAWNGTTSTPIGLTGAGYEGITGYQYSEPTFQNAAGMVVGNSRRITGVRTENGQNAWVWNGTTTTRIGLAGPGYTGSAGFQSSISVFQNAAGKVAGASFRITGVNTDNGQAAFYFDPTTLLSSAIVGSVRTSDNYAFSEPTILTQDGFLLGNYLSFPGGVGAGERRAFIFRPDLGFTDLGNLVSGGLTARGWSTLQNPLFSDALRTIVGYGFVNGQTSGQSVFVMVPAAVPPCVADVAGGVSGGPDGVVDGSDFVAFINAFGASDPQADVAGGPTGGPDGTIDGSDFIALINAFGAGC